MKMHFMVVHEGNTPSRHFFYSHCYLQNSSKSQKKYISLVIFVYSFSEFLVN